MIHGPSAAYRGLRTGGVVTQDLNFRKAVEGGHLGWRSGPVSGYVRRLRACFALPTGRSAYVQAVRHAGRGGRREIQARDLIAGILVYETRC